MASLCRVLRLFFPSSRMPRFSNVSARCFAATAQRTASPYAGSGRWRLTNAGEKTTNALLSWMTTVRARQRTIKYVAVFLSRRGTCVPRCPSKTVLLMSSRRKRASKLNAKISFSCQVCWPPVCACSLHEGTLAGRTHEVARANHDGCGALSFAVIAELVARETHGRLRGEDV